jgi:diphosphomevalonate decarboxylase
VIKYWGKDSIELNTPMNSSVSVTLDQKDLHTITTVAASKTFTSDRMWLNGDEVEINKRGKTVLKEIRALAGDRIDPNTKEVLVHKDEWPQYKVHISSVNTFPTGAGLASSAAGLACLVKVLSELYAVQESFPGQLSTIARQGSGSASRSLYGGFVKWQKGNKKDGSDSIAIQVADENHWPEMRAIILVVSDKEKDTSSTAGMSTSKKTSPLLTFRAEKVVDARMKTMEKAFIDRDFQTFGQLTMKDSNQFHATCLDTYPPIFYMTDISKTIIRLCHVINEYYGSVKAAYTFDAGPNAVIYCLDKDAGMIMSVMAKYFPAPGKIADYCSDVDFYNEMANDTNRIPVDLIAKLEMTGRKSISGDVKYMFYTKAGPGPIKQSDEECLLDPATGLPVPPKPGHSRLVINNSTLTSTPYHCLVNSFMICAVGAITGYLFAKLRK